MTELAQWTVPAPSWLDTTDDLDAGTLAHPEIIEFSGDDFVDQLRDVLDGGDPQHRRLSAMHPKGPGTEADPWRLFQPELCSTASKPAMVQASSASGLSTSSIV